MLTTAVNEILNGKPSGDRLIVGVDGLSGAGKTTFIEALKKELSTHGASLAVFHLDDHIVERATTRGQQDIADPARIDLYKRRYWAAEDYYLETEQPLLHADLVWENL